MLVGMGFNPMEGAAANLPAPPAPSGAPGLIDNHVVTDILRQLGGAHPAQPAAAPAIGGVVLATVGVVGLLGLLAYFAPPKALRGTL